MKRITNTAVAIRYTKFSRKESRSNKEGVRKSLRYAGGRDFNLANLSAQALIQWFNPTSHAAVLATARKSPKKDAAARAPNGFTPPRMVTVIVSYPMPPDNKSYTRYFYPKISTDPINPEKPHTIKKVTKRETFILEYVKTISLNRECTSMLIKCGESKFDLSAIQPECCRLFIKH